MCSEKYPAPGPKGTMVSFPASIWRSGLEVVEMNTFFTLLAKLRTDRFCVLWWENNEGYKTMETQLSNLTSTYCFYPDISTAAILTTSDTVFHTLSEMENQHVEDNEITCSMKVNTLSILYQITLIDFIL